MWSPAPALTSCVAKLGNLPPYRRYALLALCSLVPLVIFEAYQVSMDMNLDMDMLSLKHYFPADPGAGVPAQWPTASGTTKASQLHFLIPATTENDLFCAVVASTLVNKYPVPYVIGWRGEGEFDAKEAHIAKLRTIQRYLHTLPHGGEQDDLVIVGDGHDVVAQLPADVMIERYFQLVSEADRRLADRFGISVEDAHQRGLQQTLLWGADKMCWPPLYTEAQCSAIPSSNLPHNILGPKADNGDIVYRHPKFFNSGSVIGPLGDLREFIDAAVTEMEETFDPEFKYRTSDQIYLARLFGRQESSRARQISDDALFGATGSRSDVTEYHVAIDYESAFVQTGCYSHKWMRKLNYNNSDITATVFEDAFDQTNFKPYPIQMPADVYQSFLRVYHSIPEHVSSMTPREWIGSLKLDTNIVSNYIFGFYHATCSKRGLIADFTTYWFYPLIEPLLKAAFRATQRNQPITEKIIDGRRWVYKKSYPEAGGLEDQLGGVFTDFEDDEFIPYKTLCAESLHIFSAPESIA